MPPQSPPTGETVVLPLATTRAVPRSGARPHNHDVDAARYPQAPFGDRRTAGLLVIASSEAKLRCCVASTWVGNLDRWRVCRPPRRPNTNCNTNGLEADNADEGAPQTASPMPHPSRRPPPKKRRFDGPEAHAEVSWTTINRYLGSGTMTNSCFLVRSRSNFTSSCNLSAWTRGSHPPPTPYITPHTPQGGVE